MTSFQGGLFAGSQIEITQQDGSPCERMKCQSSLVKLHASTRK